MRSTHPRKRQGLVVMHGTTATIRPRHASRNFAAITKFLTRKLIISQILSVSRNFCASQIWSYTVLQATNAGARRPGHEARCLVMWLCPDWFLEVPIIVYIGECVCMHCKKYLQRHHS